MHMDTVTNAGPLPLLTDTVTAEAVLAWVHQLGTYDCRCFFVEDVDKKSTCSIVILENGQEVHREVIADDGDGPRWEQAWARAATLRAPYDAKLVELLRSQPDGR